MPKNKTLSLFVLLFLLTAIFVLLLLLRAKINTYLHNNQAFKAAAASFMRNKARSHPSPYVGEKIKYDVKMRMLTLGKAESSILQREDLDGRPLNVMTMNTRLTNFKDSEKIYSDPETLLPVKVERDIFNFLAREKITEDYDQENFTVTITKYKGAKEQKFVIKKEGHIHNAVLLPYYVRRIPKLDIGRIIVANLPTRRLVVRLDSIENIKVPAGTFRAYHFTSTPKQTEIWISADERRIPLKIQGNGPLGYYLVMNEYIPPS